jgi:hypothetical protein
MNVLDINYFLLFIVSETYIRFSIAVTNIVDVLMAIYFWMSIFILNVDFMCVLK